MDIAALSIGRTLISEPRPDRRITIEVDHEVRPQSLEEEGVLDRFKCRQSCFFRETGHCLAPTLLGCYLTDAYDGDVRCRSEVAGHLAHDVRQGVHARITSKRPPGSRWMPPDPCSILVGDFVDEIRIGPQVF